MQLLRQLNPRLTGAHHQHAARWELPMVTVVMRMKVVDRRIEGGGGRDARRVEGAGRHHDLLRPDGATAGLQPEAPRRRTPGKAVAQRTDEEPPGDQLTAPIWVAATMIAIIEYIWFPTARIDSP